MSTRPKTIFLDIDGTLVRHPGGSTEITDPNYPLEVIPGTRDKLTDWDRKGYNIVLTTGRREGQRSATEVQLSRAGIIYDQLVMGIGGGSRYLVNDMKENGETTAFAINLKRNTDGISKIDI